MSPVSGVQAEIVQWWTWMLDTLGWTLLAWGVFFVLAIGVVWALTKDWDEP